MKKNELFNSFFAKKYSLESNSSELPLNIHYKTEKRLDTLNFSNNDIEQIIQNLDPNKAHGQDKISIYMIKIYSKSVCKPLQFIFNQYTDTGSFQLERKNVKISQFIKIMINKITDQFDCFYFAEKYLTD